ncbi:conserved protein of unknown function (plasmid) [Rhodovastum atsumiense]|uniref:hypothetical protein n=1 Tax=Rhodovastum atsumiense TaxID=504468 RepID=UPI0020257DCC|nr:hypothetical protein [Rhodovastum atsumiense]CAH2605544.1 conserved protein of unknown function [Rhodovastum atsumiense]
MIDYKSIFQIRDEVQKLLGFDGINQKVNLIVNDSNIPGPDTVASGTAFIGTWMKPAEDGRRNDWVPQSYERNLLQAITEQPHTVRSAPTAVVWLHNEYDSTNANLTTEQWTSAVRADAALVRQALGQDASSVPYLFINAIPYGQSHGSSNQAIKLGMQNLAADPSFNARIAAQLADVDMNAWNDGAMGGAHMSSADASLLVDRLARSIADTFADQARPGSPVALAGGHIDALGPEARRAMPVPGNADQILVEVVHDAATGFDPLSGAASEGTGWSIRSADTSMPASAAKIVDPSHILLTFPEPVPSGANLYYAWGYGRLVPTGAPPQWTSGHGNAIYDNNGLPIWTPASGIPIGHDTSTSAPPLAGSTPITPGNTGAAAPSFFTPAHPGRPDGTEVPGPPRNLTLWTAPGRNTLVSGAGNDTLFVHADSPDGWASVLNFHRGDMVAVLGLDWAAGGHATWSNGTDQLGRTGATLTVDLHGTGHTDMTITFVGLSLADARDLANSSGELNGQPLIVWR